MKPTISALIIMFFLTLSGQSYATSSPFTFDNIKSIHSDKFCAEDEKKKKKEGEGEEEEPECD